MSFSCEICGISVVSSARPVSLTRVNPIGELPAVWRCDKCLPNDCVQDPEVEDIVNIIMEHNKKS